MMSLAKYRTELLLLAVLAFGCAYAVHTESRDGIPSFYELQVWLSDGECNG